MLVFLESLYLCRSEAPGSESPGAVLTETNANDDYSKELEMEAYRSALKLLAPDATPAKEPHSEAVVDKCWIQTDSGSWIYPLAE